MVYRFLTCVVLFSALAVPSHIFSQDNPTPADSLLARKYAPIYFFHQQEIVFPASVDVLEGKSHLVYHSRDDTLHLLTGPIADIDSLGDPLYWRAIWRSLVQRRTETATQSRKRRRLIVEAENEVRKAYLGLEHTMPRKKLNICVDIDSLMLGEFQWLGDPEFGRRTPNELGRRWAATSRSGPVCYVHVEKNVKIESVWYRPFWKEIFEYALGQEALDEYYHIIFYALFYPFNSFWNNHEGDWDSRVAVIMPRDEDVTKPAFVVYYYHHGIKLVSLARDEEYGTGGFGDYLVEYKDWVECKRRKKSLFRRECESIGKCYAFEGTHPLVFVALGSHAAYPVPGFTMMGADVPKKLGFSLCTDLHSIDGSLFVVYSPEAGEAPIDRLSIAFSGLSHRPALETIAPTTAPSLVFIDTQPWYGFPGTWGEYVCYEGWQGPSVVSYTDVIVERSDVRCLKYWSLLEKHIWGEMTILKQVPSDSPLLLYPKEGSQ